MTALAFSIVFIILAELCTKLMHVTEITNRQGNENSLEKLVVFSVCASAASFVLAMIELLEYVVALFH